MRARVRARGGCSKTWFLGAKGSMGARGGGSRLWLVIFDLAVEIFFWLYHAFDLAIMFTDIDSFQERREGETERV